METLGASAEIATLSTESFLVPTDISEFRSIPGILDAVVTSKNIGNQDVKVAYIVASQVLKDDQVKLDGLVDEWVQVSSLPIDENGKPDLRTLNELVIPSKAVIAELKGLIEAKDAVNEVIEVVVPNKSELPRYHVYDLASSKTYKAVVEDAEAEEQAIVSTAPLDLPQALIESSVTEEQLSTPVSLVESLQNAAEKYQGENFLYLGAESVEKQSFSELLDGATRIASGLANNGAQRRQHVIIHMADIKQTLTAFWGALVAECIPVITSVPPVYSAESNEVVKLKNTWQLLNTPFVLVDQEVGGKLESLNLFESSGGQTVLPVELLLDFAPLQIDSNFSVDPDDVAFICLSSGSTGIPKCIQMTHRNVITRARGANRLFQSTPEDVILNWLPFDHIGSISDWHIRCIDLGCTMVYCDKDRVLTDPLEWISTMNHYRISHTWAPNFAYASVNSVLRKNKYGHDWDLSCVKIFLTAAESVSGDTTNEFLTLLAPYGLARNSVRPAFGMAEMGSGVTYAVVEEGESLKEVFVDRDSLKGQLKFVGHRHPSAVPITSLGPLIGGMSMRIVDDQNHVLPESTVGKLHMKGLAVTPGYYKNEDANKVFLDDGWMDTGDKGFIIDGELYLSGRTKDTLVLNGANYLPIEIEKATESLPGVVVSFTAATAVKPVGDARESLALFFSPESWNELDIVQTLKAIREKVAQSIGISPNYLIPLEKERIPKTAIGKIQRSKLVSMLEAGEFLQEIIHVDHILKNERTLPDWFVKWDWVEKNWFGLIHQENVNFVCILAQGQILPDSIRQMFDRTLVSYFLLTDGSVEDTLPAHFFRADLNSQEEIEAVLRKVYSEAGEKSLCLLDLTFFSSESFDLEDLIFRSKNLAVAIQKLSEDDCVDSFRFVFPEKYDSAPLFDFSVGSFYRSAMSDLSIDKKMICVTFSEQQCSNQIAELLFLEISSHSIEEEIALIERNENARRIVKHLRPYRFSLQEPDQVVFSPQSLVVILGGFGGVGFELSQTLLRDFDVSLRVVGRTSLDAPGEKGARVNGMLNELKTLGDIEYFSGDIADVDGLSQIVSHCESEASQALNAIFHLAGVVNETPIAEQDKESLKVSLHAKVHGALAVDHLLRSRPATRAIFFSSTLSMLPSSIAPAYSAANRFLDDLSLQQRHAGLNSYSIAWSAWKGLGMSSEVDSDNGLKAQGLYGVTPSFGMLSLNLILSNPSENVMVGVSRDSNILSSLNSDEVKNIKSFGFGVQNSQHKKVTPSRIDISEIVKTDEDFSGVKIVEYDQFPRDENDQIDQAKIRHHLISQGGDELVKPQSKIEITLFKIWSEILKIDEFGVTDNFFALGGQSLAAAKLISEINRECTADFPVSFVFEASTIREQAELIESDDFEDAIEIIPLQPEGKENPIFCLCGVELYSEIAANFADDIPVYGAYLPIEGRLVKSEQGATKLYVKEMAEEYITAIKQIQVKGPYRLLGVSFGSVIAFEAAKQLEAAGESVELVVSIDFVLPEPGINRGLPLTPRKLKFKGKHWRSKLIRKWNSSIRSIPNIGPKIIKKTGPTKVNLAYQSAWERYQKEIKAWQHPEKFIVFRASNEPRGYGYSNGLDCGWSQYIGGMPESHMIEGSHLGILREDGAKEIVKIIRKKLMLNH